MIDFASLRKKGTSAAATCRASAKSAYFVGTKAEL